MGTLTFALAAGGRQVRAVEGDSALAGGAAAGHLRRPPSAGSPRARDLARRPLTAAELKDIDLTVLDRR